jgi:hypothetical protein
VQIHRLISGPRIVYALDGARVEFDNNGFAEVNEVLADHFRQIPGYEVIEEAPKEEAPKEEAPKEEAPAPAPSLAPAPKRGRPSKKAGE